MDPNETLKVIRDMIGQFRSNLETAAKNGVSFNDRMNALDQIGQLGVEISDTFDDLDDWLKKGGFLPKEWAANPGDTKP